MIPLVFVWPYNNIGSPERGDVIYQRSSNGYESARVSASRDESLKLGESNLTGVHCPHVRCGLLVAVPTPYAIMPRRPGLTPQGGFEDGIEVSSRFSPEMVSRY